MSETENTTETKAAAGADEAAAEDTTTAEAAAETASEAPAEEAPAAAEAADEAPAEAAAESTEAAEEAPTEAPAEAGDTEESAAEAPAAEAATEAASDDGEAAPAAAEDAGEPAAEAAEPAEPAVHSFDELKGMTVVQMREIAEGMGDLDALHGYTTMHKEELIGALCKAQGIEAHEHHEVVGIDKAAVKAKIRELKQQREALIAAGDGKQLKIVRRRIRGLKRKIHKATV